MTGLKPDVIVGAGVAGLTLADRLAASGGRVLVLERENSPGGLARSFQIDGFIFDIGPHRFHTSDSAVEGFVLDVLAGSYEVIPRASSVYLGGRYHSWPLSLPGLAKLPPGMLIGSIPDLLFRRRRGDATSFADHIVSRYGRNLFSFFFEGYTSKFTGLPAASLHVDWAAAGVDRAVIDRRVKADSLNALLRGMLFPRPVSTTFIYPSRGGIADFSHRLVKRVEAAGGTVRTAAEVDGLLLEGARMAGVRLSTGEEIEAERVYWSAPITRLSPGSGLSFINTILVCVALRRPAAGDYQWCYFGEQDISFSRTSIPARFSASTVPAGAGSIIAEITCSNLDDEWSEPESLVPRVLEDLERVGAARQGDVLFTRALRVPESYPLYTLDYRERLDSIVLPDGVIPIGRCGTFWYNNMDHSISQALARAGGRDVPREFWAVRRSDFRPPPHPAH